MRPSITTLTRMGLAAGALTAGSLGLVATQSGASTMTINGPDPDPGHTQEVDLDSQITPVLPKFNTDAPIMVSTATFGDVHPDVPSETPAEPTDSPPADDNTVDNGVMILGEDPGWEDGCPACGMG